MLSKDQVVREAHAVDCPGGPLCVCGVTAPLVHGCAGPRVVELPRAVAAQAVVEGGAVPAGRVVRVLPRPVVKVGRRR